MTLIEVLVALSVVAILLLPLAAVFYTGATASADNREYGAAIGLADQALAEANGISYSSLGFYEDQFSANGSPATPTTPGVTCPYSGTDPIPGYNGQDPVDLGCSPPGSQLPQVQAVDTSLKVGGTPFTLHTYVVWVAGSHPTTGSVTYPDAYKQVYAVVSWQEGGHPVSAVQNVLVYPGGLGAYSGPGNNGVPASSSGMPPSVALVGVTNLSGTGASSELDVTWDLPDNFSGYYAVVGSPTEGDLPPAGVSGSGGSGWYASSTGSSTVYTYDQVPSCTSSTCTQTVTGLAASTTYWFEVVTFSSDGSQWATSQIGPISGTTGAPPSTSCEITSLTIDQNGKPQSSVELSSKTGSTGRLVAPVTFVAPWAGCSNGDTVTVSATGTADLGPWPLTYSSSPPQYSFTLCPATDSEDPQPAFAAGPYTFTVAINGTTQPGIATNVTFTSRNKTPSC
jgi:type II secretory pathway pseudopilin PulG